MTAPDEWPEGRPPMSFLTVEEHEALELSGTLVGKLRAVVGEGPTAAHDFNELAGHVHAIQRAVMAQAAGRAYPHRYRLLGHGVVTTGLYGPGDDEWKAREQRWRDRMAGDRPYGVVERPNPSRPGRLPS